MRFLRAAVLLPAAVLAAACGAGIGAPSSTAAPGVPSASAAESTTVSAGAATTATATAAVTGGGRIATAVSHAPGSVAVVVTVTLTGPARYESGCIDSLQVQLLDGGGAVVATAPVPTPGMLRCMAISLNPLGAGQTQTFTLSLAAPRAGTYTVTGNVAGIGSIPTASVTV
jgi:hypothetical protein